MPEPDYEALLRRLDAKQQATLQKLHEFAAQAAAQLQAQEQQFLLEMFGEQAPADQRPPGPG